MPRILFLLPAVVLLIAVQAWFAARGGGAFDGALLGTDPYMRLVRVGELLETGQWYDSVIRRSNAPFGETLHWTRPLDILLAAGAMALLPAMDAREALHAAAMAINPLLHLITLVVMAWAVRSVLPLSARFFVLVLFPLQLFLSFQFAIDRPDHHGLMVLAFAWLVGALLRVLAESGTNALAVRAALPAALMAWIGVEGLVACGFALAVLTIAWFSDRLGDGRRLRVFAIALAVFVTLALAIERPPANWLLAEYDQLSVVHATLFAMIAFASLATIFAPRWPAAMAAALVPAVMWLAFPDFFKGPLAHADPDFTKLLFEYAGEVAPLADPGQFLLFAGPAALALPVLLLGWTRSTQREGLHSLLYLVGLAIYLPLSLWQARWAMYLPILYLPAFADLLAGLLTLIAGRPRHRLKIWLRVPLSVVAILAFAVGFPLTSAGLRADVARPVKCPADAMARHLDQMGLSTGRTMRIMSYMSTAPAILYRSRHEVIATPYHRNAAGGLDTLAVLSAVEDEAARQVVESRGVNHILICPDNDETRIYLPDGTAAPTLLDYLSVDAPPPWLTPVPLPETLARWYRLYEVAG